VWVVSGHARDGGDGGDGDFRIWCGCVSSWLDGVEGSGDGPCPTDEEVFERWEF
jgi:hypothetical protein